MRRLVVSVLTSLDGCYRGPDGDVAGLPFEDAFNDHNLDLLRGAGTLVYGRRWFTRNHEHWSAVAREPPAGARDREIARLVTSLDNVVVSDTLSAGEDDPWAARTRVVRHDEAPRVLAGLKAGDGGDLLVFGSGTTWNPLVPLRLVDELVVLVGAGLAGGGAPLYVGPPSSLRLLDARVLPGSQLVRLRYAAA